MACFVQIRAPSIYLRYKPKSCIQRSACVFMLHSFMQIACGPSFSEAYLFYFINLHLCCLTHKLPSQYSAKRTLNFSEFKKQLGEFSTRAKVNCWQIRDTVFSPGF
uniref:Uncharacterized protein n=1 Tax=Sphaerodactylus townsendi TaxID=933632 RepID=A0ACB8EJL4_9SAUR